MHTKRNKIWIPHTITYGLVACFVTESETLPVSAQSLLKRLDSVLTANYRKVKYDTAYIKRPQTKWTVMARLNVSGATIETEGIDNGQHYQSQMVANSKATLSLGVGYQGFTLSLALNPAKMMGKYNDYELNFNLYRHSFGFDFIYHDAKNFTGWYDQEGMERVTLPDDGLQLHEHWRQGRFHDL